MEDRGRKHERRQTDKSREGAAGGAECHLNLKDGMRMSFRSLGSRGNCISLSKRARWLLAAKVIFRELMLVMAMMWLWHFRIYHNQDLVRNDRNPSDRLFA